MSDFYCPFCSFGDCSRSLLPFSKSIQLSCPQCGTELDPSRNSPRPGAVITNCSHLMDLRAMHRSLVYIARTLVLLAKEEILSICESFDQYRPLKKVVVNASHVHSCPNQAPSASADVTFRNIDNALECIYSLESFSFEDNQLKASFSATKYCSSFLRR
jgi:uncharacterized protein (DUF983 family)